LLAVLVPAAAAAAGVAHFCSLFVLVIVLLRNRFRPRTAWLLTVPISLLIGIIQVTPLGNAVLLFALAIAGRHIGGDVENHRVSAET
jgi:hypothetical protein